MTEVATTTAGVPPLPPTSSRSHHHDLRNCYIVRLRHEFDTSRMELDASSVFAVSVLVVRRRKKRTYRAAHHHAVDHLPPTPPRRRLRRLANHHQSGSHPPSPSALRRPSMTPASTPPTTAGAVTIIGLSLSKMTEPVRRTTKQWAISTDSRIRIKAHRSQPPPSPSPFNRRKHAGLVNTIFYGRLSMESATTANEQISQQTTAGVPPLPPTPVEAATMTSAAATSRKKSSYRAATTTTPSTIFHPNTTMSPAEQHWRNHHQFGSHPPSLVFSPASVHDSSLYASHCCRSRHCHRSLSLENGGTGEEDDETVVMAWEALICSPTMADEDIYNCKVIVTRHVPSETATKLLHRESDEKMVMVHSAIIAAGDGDQAVAWWSTSMMMAVTVEVMAVREREIVENSDDAGGSDGGVGDLQDSGVSGGEARDFDASSDTFDASKNQPWRVSCSPELTISQRVFGCDHLRLFVVDGGCSFGYSLVHGVQEVGGGRDGSPERDRSSWWWLFLLLPVNGEGASVPPESLTTVPISTRSESLLPPLESSTMLPHHYHRIQLHDAAAPSPRPPPPQPRCLSLPPSPEQNAKVAIAAATKLFSTINTTSSSPSYCPPLRPPYR
nr:hypothetical protein Iba_chr05cCG10050 [Ipomoea batatas]